MIFHEIYGYYYNAVSEILSMAVKNELTEDCLQKIVREKTFQESFMEILPALKSQRWKLLNSDLSTPLNHIPNIPLSTLQLRWLKAISMDKRIKLFDVNFEILDKVEPLFTPEDYIAFDKYNDGDPFDDKGYIKIFRTILQAIQEHKKVKVKYNSSKGIKRNLICDPYELEYSEKDDKFRVHVNSCRYFCTMNLAGIKQCEIIGEAYPVIRKNAKREISYFVASLKDERNALERFLLHFSHLQRETEKLEENLYKIKIYYNKDDETEMIIRVLSFGPFVKIEEPDYFVNKIKERLKMQKSCGLK